MNQDGLAPGMERVMSPSEGGFELPSLFDALLTEAYEHGALTLSDGVRLSRLTHGYKGNRMQTLFGGEPEEARRRFVRAMLDQLTLRGLLEHKDPDRWTPGPGLVPDTYLEVVPSSTGEWVCAIVRTTPAQPPAAEAEYEQLRSERQRLLPKLAQRLARHGKGLRGRNEKAIEKIKQSVRDHGLLPEFPIIEDQYDRVLDGWQRRYAEDELRAEGALAPDERWPVQRVAVHSDAHALGIAWAANSGTPFDPRQVKSLEESGYKLLRDQSKAAYIEACLRASGGTRGSDDIAREVGCSRRRVNQVRQKLSSIGETISPIELRAKAPEPAAEPQERPKTAPRGSPRRDKEKWERVRAAWHAEPLAPQRTIAERTGVNQDTAWRIRKEMEDEGVLAPKPKSRPKTPVPSTAHTQPTKEHSVLPAPSAAQSAEQDDPHSDEHDQKQTAWDIFRSWPREVQDYCCARAHSEESNA